jgi:RNA polymerase sigma factor (sigma-70 family)
MGPTDDDLIRDHARAGSSSAFATLVERHLNLVYSVARRHVRSDALAQEVVQAVFVDLARDAHKLKPGTPLVAWLHLVARRTAIDVVRREARRQAREKIAAEISETMKTPEPSWVAMEPLLDEAVESLAERNRSAVLLRYFENKSFREVGATLGLSEDAAQKRVSRAVDELRTFFMQRGIAVTAAGLATHLSAHALQTAPTGLGLAISSAAASSVASSAVVAMTTLQKSAAAIAFITFGGLGLYEATLAARQSDELAARRIQTERTAAEVRTLRTTRAATDAQLNRVESQIDARLARVTNQPASDPALESQMRDWLSRMDTLKHFLASRPELNTPELQLLSQEEWFEIAGGKALASEAALRRAAADLRNRAQGHACAMLGAALRAHLKAHDNVLPATPLELAASAATPIDRAILERFEMRHTGKIGDVPHAELTKVIGGTTPADPEFDHIPYLGPNGYTSEWAIDVNVRGAVKAYTNERGEKPSTAAQLKPYLKWPANEEEVQRRLARMP